MKKVWKSKKVKLTIFQVLELEKLLEEKMASLDMESEDSTDAEYWCYLNNILTVLEEKVCVMHMEDVSYDIER